MKNTFIKVFILFLGTTLIINAQKIGHVNSLEVMEKLPERLKADEELQAQGTKVRAELEKMTKALEEKYKKYEAEAPNQTKENNTKRAEEVQTEQAKIQEYQANAAKELEAKQVEKYKPIIDKVQAAINKVGKTKALTYIFDSSQQGLIVYIDPTTANDITTDVKTELGVK